MHTYTWISHGGLTKSHFSTELKSEGLHDSAIAEPVFMCNYHQTLFCSDAK